MEQSAAYNANNNQGTASRLGSAAVANPFTTIKAIFIGAVVILVLVLLWKFIKGISKVSQVLGEVGPMSEEDKRAIVEDPDFQSALKWLDDRIGLETIIQKGHYKNIDQYLRAKGIPRSVLEKAAEGVWESIHGAGTNETQLYSALGSLPSKAAISLTAGIFNTVYKKYTSDRMNVFIANDLDTLEMQTLTQIINKKPDL